jgi:hypothetical protein
MVVRPECFGPADWDVAFVDPACIYDGSRVRPVRKEGVDLLAGVFDYSIRRIRILKKWKNSIRIRIRQIRIRIGKSEFDSREM